MPDRARYRIKEILEADRQSAITEARAHEGPAHVIWDFTIEAWGLECSVCVQRKVWRPGDTELTHGAIKDHLLAAAERHNKERHSY